MNEQQEPRFFRALVSAAVPKEKLLDAVLETAEWIKQYEIPTEYGKIWRKTPEHETDAEDSPLVSSKSLYGGSAGIGFFYLRLYLATQEEKWLEEAKSAANHILATYEGKSLYGRQDEGTLKGIGTGVFNGAAGQAYFAEQLYDVTKEQKYRDFVVKATDDLTEAATICGDGIYWGDASGIIADGGLILYLLYIYEKTGNEKYLQAAEKAGIHIRNQAKKAPQGGIRWYAMDSVKFGLGEEGYFPNFFYGTAGNAYVQARLYKATGNQTYLDAAKRGAEYVMAVADTSGDAALVRYNDPYRKDLYYLGMCQGPIGTSRLFYELYRITGDENYKSWVLRLTNGIVAAGAPAKHSPGYWHTYCYCCGAPGMLEHFLGVYHSFGNEKYFELAKEAGDVVLRDSYADKAKRRWYTAWNRHLPNETDVYTGLYHGSAGCANALLSLYCNLAGIGGLPGFLEDPYQVV